MAACPAIQQLPRLDARPALFVLHGNSRMGDRHGTQYLAARCADGSAVVVALADVTPHPCTPSENCTITSQENASCTSQLSEVRS